MRVLASVLFLMFFASFDGYGQPPDTPPPNPNPVPITGIEILLVGGGAYGIYRLSRNIGNKNNK
jgi:hypothetical protein